MKTIRDILAEYRNKIDPLDLELLISAIIGKPREFVLAHPECKIPITRSPKLKAWIKRRIEHEPIAYILSQKEFYGLNFKVNRHTLIPRPESELLVEQASALLRSMLRNKLRNTTVIDVGTGSGNIIISIANELKKSKLQITNYKLLAIDISGKALKVARQNARIHNVDKKIKFLQGNLLEKFINNNLAIEQFDNLIVVANLPYLSKNIYDSVSPDIKKYEPKSALLSGKNGLAHYEKLLRQIKKLRKSYPILHVSCFMEIGPAQKHLLPKLLKATLPDAEIGFQKDLAGKWRLAIITSV